MEANVKTASPYTTGAKASGTRTARAETTRIEAAGSPEANVKTACPHSTGATATGT